MTNEQIIQDAAFALVKAGKLGTTGRVLTVRDDAGNEFELPEPLPLHTYAVWKSLGYQVKKGEHSIIKLTIWKHVTKTTTDEDGNETTNARMFPKLSHFFSWDQVQPINS